MKKYTVTTLLLFVVLMMPFSALAQGIITPNDPSYREEWGLQQIGAPCAWQHTIGSPAITVAIVDSGVDLRHPDLVGRLRDDGRDFVDGDDDPSDENGHGTNVAGIVAATLNNNEGIVGAAPGVMILPVRVMNAKGYGSDRAIARGVRYAADQGAKVINLSLGATLTIGADTESAEVTSAIRYAQGQGALVVVAAGNDFVPLPNAIVGDNPDVLIVAATDESDVKADFSNSGPWISVTAPGVHILSTMPTYEVYLTSSALPRDERFQQDYDYMSGTSQATPFVSALAALVFSEHPDWSAGQVAQTIKEHAAAIAEQNPELVTKGWLGSGRIDACQSLGGPLAPTESSGSSSVIPFLSMNSDALIVLVGLICGVVLLFLFFGMLMARAKRRTVPVMTSARPLSPTPPPAWVPPPAPMMPPASSPARAAWGRLTVIGGPAQMRSYALVDAVTQIGRSDECAVLLIGDGTVSRRHALVRNDGQRVTVEDVGSTHGTYLRGSRVTVPISVQRGDVLQVGQTLLRFE